MKRERGHWGCKEGVRSTAKWTGPQYSEGGGATAAPKGGAANHKGRAAVGSGGGALKLPAGAAASLHSGCQRPGPEKHGQGQEHGKRAASQMSPRPGLCLNGSGGLGNGLRHCTCVFWRLPSGWRAGVKPTGTAAGAGLKLSRSPSSCAGLALPHHRYTPRYSKDRQRHVSVHGSSRNGLQHDHNPCPACATPPALIRCIWRVPLWQLSPTLAPSGSPTRGHPHKFASLGGGGGWVDGWESSPPLVHTTCRAHLVFCGSFPTLCLTAMHLAPTVAVHCQDKRRHAFRLTSKAQQQTKIGPMG